IRLTHQRVALEDLGMLAHGPLEAQQRITAVAYELDVREHHHREPELLSIEQRHALPDDAELLEAAHAAPARRGRHAQALGHFSGRQRPMLLDESEHPEVDSI